MTALILPILLLQIKKAENLPIPITGGKRPGAGQADSQGTKVIRQIFLSASFHISIIYWGFLFEKMRIKYFAYFTMEIPSIERPTIKSQVDN